MVGDQTHQRNVLQYLRRNPGAHLRKIHRALDIPLTSLARLLWNLEDEGRLMAERDGFFTRYWTQQRPRSRERDIIALLHNDRVRRIAQHLHAQPDASHGETAEALDLPPSSLTYYLKKFEELGLLHVTQEGVVRRYRLKNPKLVSNALRKVRPEPGRNAQ